MSRQQALEIGISDFIMKPVSKQELACAIKRALKRPEP